MRTIAVILALLGCAFTLHAADDLSVIRVMARYPGAKVQVVDSTIALPLLKQIHDVEGATRVETESTNDGVCTITIHLDAKTDPAKIQELVRNRVALAEPIIPKLCKSRGIEVRLEPTQTVEFWFALTIPDDFKVTTIGQLACRKYADGLRLIPGVSKVLVVGTADYSWHVQLDKEKLKARTVSIEEVRSAMQALNIVVVGITNRSPKGPLLWARSSVQSPGASDTISKSNEIVVKTEGSGQKILLGDVAEVRIGSMVPNELTAFGSKPAVLISVSAKCNTSLKEIEKNLELQRKRTPQYRQPRAVITAIAPTTPRVLHLEVEVPIGSTMEYAHATCEKIMKIALDWNDNLPAISFTDRLQSNRAVLLVTCKPDADAAKLQKLLASEVRKVIIRISDATGGKPAFPVRIALVGSEAENLRKWSERILTRVSKDGVVRDANWPVQDRTHYVLIFNNDKITEFGIDLAKALDTFSDLYPLSADKPMDLNNLFVKNAKGQMVPFSAFATRKRRTEEVTIYRLGLERAIRITANPADGKSVTACAEKLRALAESEKTTLKLTTGYRATILVP